jgi:chromosome segregation ATPase
MTEEYIGKREFDGFGNTVREGFNRLQENMTQVSVKLDTLVNSRIEEARVIGEISGEIRAINQRLERLERDGESKQKEIDDLWTEHNAHADGKIRWFYQLIALGFAAISGALASHFIK